MHANSLSHSAPVAAGVLAVRVGWYGRPGGDDGGDGAPQPIPFNRAPSAAEDLPYKVELWDPAKKSVEQVLAVTANASIGFAAYYGATKEYPDRYITLRHKNSIVSRWNGPQH